MEKGRQPCKDFNPGTGYHAMYNYHECPGGCTGLRRFCENCHLDHHDGGWDSCTGDASRRSAEGPTA